MHIVSINTDDNSLGLKPGEYICEDVNAGEIMARGWSHRVRFPDEGEVPVAFDAQRCKRALFVRPGGFGDLLFMTPTIRHLKKNHPDMEIFVACFEQCRPALENNPDISGFVKYPVALTEWPSFDGHIWLEGVIEDNPDAMRVHAVDLIANRAGVTLQDRSMRYTVTRTELEKALSEFPSGNMRRIGVQVSASAMCRVYTRMNEVVHSLWKDGHEIFLFGRPGEVETPARSRIVNLMSMGKSFRESCAIMMTCDVVIAPDSALAHVAGALNVPCVALYGPFPWTLRTAYAPKTRALQGTGRCAPCFHHVRGGVQFPNNGPCRFTGKCEVLDAIPPERVVREVQKQLEKLDVQSVENRYAVAC